ncbi:MAG: hypothetical protein QME79_14445 [Bacillota bacterium]|nr:hypothetical protein [Bacillota bacterium]
MTQGRVIKAENVITDPRPGQPVDTLRPQEAKLIRLLRWMRSGRLEIKVQDGVPVHVEEVHRNIKLGGTDD